MMVKIWIQYNNGNDTIAQEMANLAAELTKRGVEFANLAEVEGHLDTWGLDIDPAKLYDLLQCSHVYAIEMGA
jgi:hypothetical protein